MQIDATGGGGGGGIVQAAAAADSQHPFAAGSPATLDASQPLLPDVFAARLPDACPPLTVANQSPVVLGSSLQPWRRRINSSIMKRIINMTPKILQVWFGWRTSQGQPRMCITVGGKTLRLAGKDATVMEFNREGRDGFPVKARWVGLILESLGAALGDTLVLQHTRTDSSGVMHVTASLERAAPREGSAGDAQLTSQPSSASATDNFSMGENNDFPTGSTRSDARWQLPEDDEVQQPAPATKKRRRELEAEPAPEVLECPHCKRTYRYEGPFNKHVHSCELKAMAALGNVHVKRRQHPPGGGHGSADVPGEPCSPHSSDAAAAAALMGMGNTSGPSLSQLPSAAQPLQQQAQQEAAQQQQQQQQQQREERQQQQQQQREEQNWLAEIQSLQHQTAKDSNGADRHQDQSSLPAATASWLPTAAGNTVLRAEAVAAAAMQSGKPFGGMLQATADTLQEAMPPQLQAQQRHAPALAPTFALAQGAPPLPQKQQQRAPTPDAAPAPAPAPSELPHIGDCTDGKPDGGRSVDPRVARMRELMRIFAAATPEIKHAMFVMTLPTCDLDRMAIFL
ncbi:hypothetical protein ACK3TF_000305 [Chlorella vulgaris]